MLRQIIKANHITCMKTDQEISVIYLKVTAIKGEGTSAAHFLNGSLRNIEAQIGTSQKLFD